MIRVSKPKYKSFAEFWEAEGRKVATGHDQLDAFFGWNARQGEVNEMLSLILECMDTNPMLEQFIANKLEALGYSVEELKTAFMES